MSRPPKPVESFGPELLRALLEGAKRKVEVKLPHNKAVHLRQRINALRTSMRRSNHVQYPLVSQCRVTISWPPETPTVQSSRGVRWPKDPYAEVVVTIAPNDSEFRDVLASAGVVVDPGDILTSHTPSSAEDDILAEFLKPSGG